MASISPTPPPIRSSFEDKITRDSTVLPDNIVIHEGKEFKVVTIQHGTIWKVWQGTQAIFLSIFSLGIGLTFQSWRDAIKNKWHNATTGVETRCISTRLKRSPPEIPTTTKTSEVSATLQPIKESPKIATMPRLGTTPEPVKEEIPIDQRIRMNEFIEDVGDLETKKLEPHRETLTEIPTTVRNLLDEAREHLSLLKDNLTIAVLEKRLEEALNVSALITTSDDKTTIFAISELVARHYVSTTKEFDKATELRIRTALAISPAPPLSKLSDVLKTENPKLGLRLQPVDTSLFKNQTLIVQNRRYSDGTARLHLDAKISHPTRKELQPTLEWIAANPKKLLDALPKDFCTGVSVTNDYIFL